MKILLTIPFLLTTLSLSSQNFAQHRWQNRLLIIVDKDGDSNERFEQLAKLKNDLAGLKERKLLVYQLSKKGYQKGIEPKMDWLPFTDKKNKFIQKAQKESFTVYLIGLDCGIKMKKTKIVDISTIFSLIDGMPMRQAELKGH